MPHAAALQVAGLLICVRLPALWHCSTVRVGALAVTAGLGYNSIKYDMWHGDVTHSKQARFGWQDGGYNGCSFVSLLADTLGISTQVVGCGKACVCSALLGDSPSLLGGGLANGHIYV